MDMRYVLLVVLVVALASGFKQLHEQNHIIAFYEQNSFKPFLHVYYNRHFKNSSQFKEFEQIISQLHYDHGDYIDIVFTDCDKDTGLKLNMCKQMNKTKDNRQIVGTIPSSEFRRLGDKLIQSPPSSQVLEHSRDRYTYTQLREFMKALLPNFLKELNNKDQFEDFLHPRYSPKFIAFVREDQQIPAVFKQIAIAFFLKVDFALITDLNQQLLPLFNFKSYPSFVIITYNFNQSKHEYHYYPRAEFSQTNYFDIKQFVSKFALSEPRNDLVFHKIQMEKQAEIITVQTEGQLEQVKQRANGWVIIVRGDGKIPQQLAEFREKYDRYFSYVNYVHEPFGKVQIYNPSQNFTIPFQQKLEFNYLDFEYFKSNMTVWLSKDMVVLGVVQDYSYVCGVAQKFLFRGHVRCLIISKEGEDELKQFMKIDFKVGFIVRSQNTNKKGNENRETKGVKLMTDNFESVYNQMDFATRTQIKQTMDDYINKPIGEVREQMTLQQACSHPFKKCLLLVTNLGKQDRTLQQYIKQIAFDYINSFIVYQVDIQKNPQLIKAIGGIKDKKADLVVYSSRTEDQFIKLNRKVTKNIISQFMKANLKNDKRLKKQTYSGLDKIIIKRRLGNQKNQDVQIGLNQQL